MVVSGLDCKGRLVYAQHVRMGKTSPVMSDARCGFFPITYPLGAPVLVTDGGTTRGVAYNKAVHVAMTWANAT